MRAIQLNGWYLEFDGETYGPFRTPEEALAFDDQEHTDAEVAAKLVKRPTEHERNRAWAAGMQRKHFSDTR
jgi:hypothetical protein